MSTVIDIRALKERAEKARNITITVKGGWQFHLNRPSDMVLRDALADPAARATPSAFQAKQVFACLQGWTGPTVKDVDPQADADIAALPLPFDKALFDALFGDRPMVLDEIGAKLVQGFTERLKERMDAEKNSQSSSGSVPS